ncbi:MAG TPA: methyltransferase domain-containing protein [bacterium]|nr:methyltransferase domain-containing protein [bacterium]
MSRTAQSKMLSNRYGKGYFHGENSGYPREGYATAHPSRRFYLHAAQTALGANLQWLDVGCAYGYLIEEAEELGIRAVGADISAYALRQHAPVRGRLVQAQAETLPFPDASLDVVSVFDLVEHLENPVEAIQEWKRILRPDGLLFLTTPDPCYFQRDEPTHLFERPPAFWVNCLCRLGLDPVIRFGGEFFECEICARKSESIGTFDLPEFTGRTPDDIFPPPRQGDVFVAPRLGWGNLEKDERGAFRWIGKTSALYLLNAGRQPVRCRLSIRGRTDSHPTATLGEQRLRHLPAQDDVTCHEWEPFDLPVGGQVLYLSVGEGNALAADKIGIRFEPLDTSQYLEELPFDLYQRYRLVAEVIDILRSESSEIRILEVGGFGSPLPDFLKGDAVTVTDLIWEDRPQFLACDAAQLPYRDLSFDFAVGCDFLEHVPPQRRKGVLTELRRVARYGAILMGPTDREDVRMADSLLRRFLIGRFGRDNRFLMEHEEHGLPDVDAVSESLSEDGWHSLALPSGLLERWLPMQFCMAYLESVAELLPLKREINRLYNQNYYRHDNDSPSYRTLVLATFRKLDSAKQKSLVHLLGQGTPCSVPWSFAAFLTELFNIDFLRERSQEIRHRDRHIRELLAHAQALEKARTESARHADNVTNLLTNEQAERDKLRQHADNLANLLNQKEERIGELNRHVANLTAQLESASTERTRLESLIGEQNKAAEALSVQVHDRFARFDERLAGLLAHANNLEHLLREKDERIASLLDHCANQEKLLEQSQKQVTSLLEHSGNLEKILQDKESQLAHLRETANQLEESVRRLQESESRLQEELRTIQAGLAYRILAKVGGGKRTAPASPEPSDSAK